MSRKAMRQRVFAVLEQSASGRTWEEPLSCGGLNENAAQMSEAFALFTLSAVSQDLWAGLPV